jgi:hypothetical protein
MVAWDPVARDDVVRAMLGNLGFTVQEKPAS